MREPTLGSPLPRWQSFVQDLAHVSPFRFVRRLTLAQQLLLSAFVIMTAGLLILSWRLGQQIERHVIQRTVTINASYIESVIAPLLLPKGGQGIDAKEMADLDTFVSSTSLGREIVALLIWGPGDTILYSTTPGIVGRHFPPDEELDRAWEGRVAWELSDENGEEHIPPQNRSQVLLATYAPIRSGDGTHVIAVAEVYQPGDPLRDDIATIQRSSWLNVSIVIVVMYLLLAGFVRRASRTITRQQSELQAQVSQLTELLTQIGELSERVQRASRRATTLNERILRRISADLHDGPTQYLSLSLLHIDRIAAYLEQARPPADVKAHAETAHGALVQALRELRGISSGMGLPDLERLSPEDLIELVALTHSQRTRTEVYVNAEELPGALPLPLKIAVYRMIQEGLSNAYRHAGGRGQQVHAWVEDDQLWAEVLDAGPGFTPPPAAETSEHLGLAGMRERIESLGGTFSIISHLGQGTLLRASLPLQAKEEDDV